MASSIPIEANKFVIIIGQEVMAMKLYSKSPDFQNYRRCVVSYPGHPH